MQAQAASTEPVARVYVSLPRQGDGAPSAAKIATGLRTALAERGGVAGGHRIRIVWMDGAKGARWNRQRVVANARRAAADPTAVAYVGEGNSEASAVSMPIVNRAGLAHLSPVSTATALTDDENAGRYQPTGIQTFFRPIPGDARQSAALLSAVRRAGARHRVVVVDDGMLYGRGLTQGFRAGAEQARVRVVGGYVADRDGAGLRALASRVAAKRPTAIVYGGAPSSGAARVLRALHRAAPKAALFGGDALAHDDFVNRLGRAQKALWITSPAAHVDPRRKAGRGLGSRPDPFSVFAHNGMRAVLRAIDRAGGGGSVTRASVREAVFDGSIQHGLSGSWKLTDRGDSVYGVYDLLRAANGRISTPVDRVTEKLVRRAREGRKAPATTSGRATTRTHVTGSHPGPSLPGLANALTLDSRDIETALMMVQSERTRMLDAQLQDQIREVQERNRQIARLNDVLAGLNAIVARFPAGSAAGARLDASGTVDQYAAAVDALRSAISKAGVTLELGDDAGSWTKGALDQAVARIKGMIDTQSNTQQMDMLRLQSLTNKRNEAFDVMTEFIRRMEDARKDIIGDMR